MYRLVKIATSGMLKIATVLWARFQRVAHQSVKCVVCSES